MVLRGLALATAQALWRDVGEVIEAAPLRHMTTPGGLRMSVAMTNCGALGWMSDRAGYRYQPDHPETGAPWPTMPDTVRAAWDALAAGFPAPEACLINLYPPGAGMGLHQDRDETDLSAPVVSLSLGAAAVFRYGGLRRSDPTRSIRLTAGDALVIGGASRLIHHGVDRIVAGGDLLSEAEDLLPAYLPPGGRCNLTLRRVTGAAP
ncbi:MAG: alpha-ketoglutarate-dependent dioxygenase AlkB [Comamonadaceae bacterium]|nr:MAG: alpha-ketoglutarate-dependent dioxygenase AlkB [Comamonadaceae bacterium]